MMRATLVVTIEKALEVPQNLGYTEIIQHVANGKWVENGLIGNFGHCHL